jgi:hypothetical protein
VTQEDCDWPAVKREEQALEVLNHRAQIGLDLHFASATIPGARQAVVLLRLGEEPLNLPHPVGRSLEEHRVSHASLHFLNEILVYITITHDEVKVTCAFA